MLVAPTGHQNISNKLSLQAFEDAVGGRQRLADVLSLAELSEKQQHFLRLLVDPRRAKDTLANIVHDAGILPMHVLGLFRDAAFAKAHAIAISTISDSVPAVVGDIVQKSVDAEITCPDCMGEMLEGSPCFRCHDRGTIMRPSDIDRQKLLLEISGLHKKSSGVQLQVNQNVQNNTIQPGTFFSKYVRESDSAAYDVAIESEPVPTPDEPTDV